MAKIQLWKSKRTWGGVDGTLWESTVIRRPAFSSHLLILTMDTDLIHAKYSIFLQVNRKKLSYMLDSYNSIKFSSHHLSTLIYKIHARSRIEASLSVSLVCYYFQPPHFVIGLVMPTESRCPCNNLAPPRRQFHRKTSISKHPIIIVLVPMISLFSDLI